MPLAQTALSFDPADIARQLVAARLAARPLPAYPGPLPADMAAGYAVQDRAISLWPDEVAGWKVGWIAPDLQASLGAQRVMGPVFAKHVRTATAGVTTLEVIAGGFAAVEAEYVYQIGQDAPAGQTTWTPQEALDYVEVQRVGVEFAASPLATINILGPRVVASDFGNNAGLILGPAVPDWRSRSDDWPPCEVFVDEVSVGRGSPASLNGGPQAALAYLMGICAERGRPLRKGQWVTTGAASGIHDIKIGQTARISFDGLAEIHCLAKPATARGA